MRPFILALLWAATAPAQQLATVPDAALAPRWQQLTRPGGGGAPVLRLEDVLESVKRSYPPLLAVIQDLDIAEGDIMAALGRFDLAFRFRSDVDSLGFYSNDRYDIGVEQPTQLWGASFTGGWRLGEGSFASYDGKLETRNRGEWRAGMRLPLFRDRAIDSRRADLRKTQLGRQIASLSIDQQKLVIVQSATRRYWEWLASGRRLTVAQALLDTALQRDGILKEGVKLGQLPAIEVTENERAILQRRSQIVEAERGLEQASIELSLFYRDASGDPVLAAADRLPPAFPDMRALTPDKLDEDIALALKSRPEITRLGVQRDQTKVDAALARNQRLPGIDIVSGFTYDAGDSLTVKRGPQELKTALVFDLPFQRRNATGRLKAAEARIAQIDLREKFQRDQVVAEVRDAVSAVEAAYRRGQLLRDEVRVARQLEEMERARFDLGDSTLFLVNLREQATFDAQVREVVAQADYFRAYALYDLAIAEALRRP